MEPPQQGTFDFSQVDAHFQGNTDFKNDNPLGRREKLLDIASSFFNYARDIGSSLLQGCTFVYGILVNLLQLTAIAFGVLVYVLNEITLIGVVVLRILARHCEAGATLLESMHLRSRGRFARRPTQVVQSSLATARVRHSHSPAQSTVRPPIQTIMPADVITVDSQVSENQYADDDTMEETEAYEIRYQGVSRDSRVESITQTAQRVMTKKKKLTPKQLGRQRIRAYREQRKLKGLKV